MQIQQGTYAEDIISPREAMLLAEQWHIKLPENSVTSSHRNHTNQCSNAPIL